MIQKTFTFLLLIFPLLFTACYEEEPTKPKRVLLKGEPSEENYTLAQKYFENGEYEKALAFHLKQLEEDSKYYADESLEIALNFNNIALDHDALENYEKALTYYVKTMAIDEKILEHNSTERSSTYYNVASAYDALGEHHNAIKYYAKALAIDKVKLGVYDEDVLAEYEKLAIAYEKISKFNNSLRYWKKALSYKEHEYGKYDLDTNETRAEVLKLEKIVKAEKELLKKIK